YYYRADVVLTGHTYTGSVHSFTTSSAAAPSQTPTVATGSASQITTNSALLGGTINPGGTQAVRYHFAYGSSAGSLTATTPQASGPSGTTAIPAAATVLGLKAH